MYHITYKGENCAKYGIIPVRRPSVPAPEIRVEEIEIPGRDGVLVENHKTYFPLVIPVEFNFLVSPHKWMDAFRKAKRWLSGSGPLILGDDQDYLYKVYYCKITDAERTSLRLGRFTVEFTCDPYAYVVYGQKEHEISDVKYNPYNISHPIYLITGEGMCTLMVNGNTMTANIGQNLTINTDLMLSYRKDGTVLNTNVSGEYEGLYLKEEDNDISITSGFNMMIIPNWRCL